LLTAVLTSTIGCSDGPTGPWNPNDTPEKAWTLLVYNQADFSNAVDILADHDRAAVFSKGLLNQVREGDNLNVLVLVDRESGPAHILSINESHQADTIEAWGEVNMGDGGTLATFLAFGKEHYRAERYILSVFGHGAGWYGACADESNGNDPLTMGEMKDALFQVGGVDLILMNTPCLMGMVEVAYNLRDVTDVLVASEFRSGWVNEPMGDLSNAVSGTPEISTEALGSLFVNSIWAHRMVWENVGWPDSLTSSAIRTDRLLGVKDQIHALSVQYRMRPGGFQSLVAAITPDLTTFHPTHVDLFDLAEELLTVEHDQATRAILDALKTAVRDVVIAEVHGPAWEDTHGLAVFLPHPSDPDPLNRYRQAFYGLDLVEETLWDELLVAAFGSGGSAEGPAGSSSLPSALDPPVRASAGDPGCGGLMTGG